MEIVLLVVGLILATIGSVFLSRFGIPSFVSALMYVVSIGASLGVVGIILALLIGVPVMIVLYSLAGVIGLIPVAIMAVRGNIKK